jgi:hypothetical protein
MRERGNGMKTIHLNKALKHVDKFFGKKNVNEKFTEATQVISSTLGKCTQPKEMGLVPQVGESSKPCTKFCH